MKKIKIQILLVGALLGNAVSMHGMMQQGVRLRPGLTRRPIIIKTPQTPQGPQGPREPIIVTMPSQPGEPSGEGAGQKSTPFSSSGFRKTGFTVPVVDSSEDTEFGKKLHSWWRSLWSGTQPSSMPVKSANVEVSSSPVGQSGQKRQYSSSRQSSGVKSFHVPESFAPSLKSKLPWTNEYQIEVLFQKMKDGLKKNDFPEEGIIEEFKGFIEASDYNPLNRYIQGEPSFFAELLDRSLNKSVDDAYFTYKYPYPEKEKIIEKFYAMGARCEEAEYFDQTKIGSALKKIAEKIRINNVTSQHNLRIVVELAKVNIAWHEFLDSIALGSSFFDNPNIDWNAMKKLSKLILDDSMLDEKISYAQENPLQILNFGQLEKADIRGKGLINSEYLINLLKPAGFSKISARRDYQEVNQKQYERQGFGTGAIVGNFVAAQDAITKLLGIEANSSEGEIWHAYFEFAWAAREKFGGQELDKFMKFDIVESPLLLKFMSEIQPAWAAYSELLELQKQNRE